jgi:hypothetical protein
VKAAAEPAANEAGLDQAIKVLMDIDGMAPIERQVFRHIFPFYPFTRQLLRYMAKFPAEHPMKAAVLAAVGRMELADAQSGLPLNMMSLFPIGGTGPDGKAFFIDTKNMNPFRSMNGMSPLTMAGFLSELNPIISLPFVNRGFNVLTATPELYPNLTVDPNTGDLVAKPSKNIVQSFVEGIIPETNTLEAMFGISNSLTQLQQSDPEAYARALYSYLNIPFAPGSRNLNTQRIRYARNLYNVAQSAASQAVKSGDVSGLNYDVVPYGGKLWTVSQLQKALQNG